MSESAVEHAKRVGTYGKIDRSKQYEGEFDGLDEVLLGRKVQNKFDHFFAQRRREENLKFWHRAALMAGAALLARAPEIWAWLSRVF